MEELTHENGGTRGLSRRKALARMALLGGGALSLPAILAACGGEEEEERAGAGAFPETPEWNFVFVNHVTTNPFFVPTQYGIEDANALLGTKHQWTGSERSDVAEMVSAFNTAITAKADGIAVSIIDPKAFNEPVERALDAGIPVVSYNADAPPDAGNKRMAYIGQDLFLSGVKMGERIVELVDEGLVAGYIATPGSLNIQPRIDGAAQAIKDSGKNIDFQEIATGPSVEEELAKIEAFYLGHKDLKGMFAVDAGSTQGTAQVMKKHGLKEQGIAAGGYDLLPTTLQLIKEDHLDFTIDQQPYQQGFWPVLQLFLNKLSGGLQAPSDTNTGLLFVTTDTVDPYLTTKTRFEGSSEEQKLVEVA